VGIIITGNEIFSGMIKDEFEPILRRKVTDLNSTVIDVVKAPDELDFIKGKIRDFLDQGADLILTTGGMSVDPDDVTRKAVVRAGADACTYGASVLPGAMFMIAYVGNVPVLGIPACGIYHEITLFDLLFPRFLAGERIDRRDIAVLGHGGLCLDCTECRYPRCPFGKGA
jgi:molybdopterin biosynthesis enzyme